MNQLLLDNGKKAARKAVHEVLKKMQMNLRHPSLNTHKYDEMQGPDKEDVFESYAQITLQARTGSFGIMDQKRR